MATRTVTAEDLGLSEAIAETENEIFTDANGDEALDNDGDKSLEEMGDGLEGQHEDEADEPATEEEIQDEAPIEEATAEREETPAPQEPNRERPGMVPSGRLREIREQKDAEIAALRAEFESFKAGLNQRPQQQEQPKPPEKPDMFADPDGYTNWVMQQAQQAVQVRHVESSLQEAADTHGEKFQAAYQELQRLGNTERSQFNTSPTVARIWGAPNPGRALMSWYQQQQTIREVGNDPNAWLERKLEERLSDPDFLATAVERARGTARQNGARTYTAPRTPNLPSLNSQTGRGTHAETDPELYNNSESSVFAFATK